MLWELLLCDAVGVKRLCEFTQPLGKNKTNNKKNPKTQKKTSFRSNKYRISFVVSLSQFLSTSLKDPYQQA